MQVKVEYRKMFTNGNVSTWRVYFPQTYNSMEAAIEAVEQSYGSLRCNKLYNVIFNGEVGIYEMRDLDYQYRFLANESPWKIGLNDESIHCSIS